MNIYDKFIFSRYLEEDEQIEFIVHKHWFVIFFPTIKITLFWILPPLFLILFFTGFDLYNPFFYLFALWALIGFTKFFYLFADWYFDVWIFTAHGVIDLEWVSLFQRISNRIGYGKMDDTAYTFSGFWGYILRFGNITLGKSSNGIATLEDVPNPQKVESKIIEIHAKHTEKKKSGDSEAIKELLAEVIATHIEEKELLKKHDQAIEEIQEAEIINHKPHGQ